jgi:hypothetical protein
MFLTAQGIQICFFLEQALKDLPGHSEWHQGCALAKAEIGRLNNTKL